METELPGELGKDTFVPPRQPTKIGTVPPPEDIGLAERGALEKAAAAVAAFQLIGGS